MTPQETAGNGTSAPGKLARLVEYQDGSVVSRVVLKAKGGAVTLFAFTEGEGLSEHTAPFDALVHVLEGEADVGIAGVHHRLGNGDFIVLPANVPHSVSAVVRFKMLLIMLREGGEAG
jgi:quercetin dioxygenase-like cupin family protein